MSDEYTLNDVKEVKEFLEKVYKKEYPDLVISPRITERIFHKIVEDYDGPSAELDIDNTELCDYLKNDYFIGFIKDRQPNVSKVPDSVIKDVISYFKTDISGFMPVKVCRHSNHPEDVYLYSVIAKHENSDAYACWSTFNDSTKSLNHGHYYLSGEDDALEIIKDKFFDITDDIDSYGPEKSMTDVPELDNQLEESEGAEMLAFRRRTR